jgi:hypothetical protein
MHPYDFVLVLVAVRDHLALRAEGLGCLHE